MNFDFGIDIFFWFSFLKYFFFILKIFEFIDFGPNCLWSEFRNLILEQFFFIC